MFLLLEHSCMSHHTLYTTFNLTENTHVSYDHSASYIGTGDNEIEYVTALVHILVI